MNVHTLRMCSVECDVQGLADKSDEEDDAWNEDAEEGEEEDVKESDPLIEPFEKPKRSSNSSSSGKAAKVVQQEAAVETEQKKEVHAEKKEPTRQVTGVCKGDEKTDCKLQATSTPSPTEPNRLPSDEAPPATSDAENAGNLFKLMFFAFLQIVPRCTKTIFVVMWLGWLPPTKYLAPGKQSELEKKKAEIIARLAEFLAAFQNLTYQIKVSVQTTG